MNANDWQSLRHARLTLPLHSAVVATTRAPRRPLQRRTGSASPRIQNEHFIRLLRYITDSLTRSGRQQ
jgi:hypothetical protein